MDTQSTKEMITNTGESVFDISKSNIVLLVFLRHFGCIFCKEALFDIAKKRKHIEVTGKKIILVHMATHEVAADYLKNFGIKDIVHVSDPTCQFYKNFGLVKGSTSQLMGLKNWVRGFEVSVGKGIEVSIRQIGDAFQMPGVFVLSRGKIINSYIHKTAADRPNYEKLLECCQLEISS